MGEEKEDSSEEEKSETGVEVSSEDEPPPNQPFFVNVCEVYGGTEYCYC